MSMACFSRFSWIVATEAAGFPNLRTIFAPPESLNDPCENSQQLPAEIVRVGENRQVSWRDGIFRRLSVIADPVALQAIADTGFRYQKLWLAWVGLDLLTQLSD